MNTVKMSGNFQAITKTTGNHNAQKRTFESFCVSIMTSFNKARIAVELSTDKTSYISSYFDVFKLFMMIYSCYKIDKPDSSLMSGLLFLTIR